MNWGRFALAGVVGFIVMFVVGFVWHVPLLGDFYAEQVREIALPEMGIPAIILAELIRGLVMAFVYPLGYKGGPAAMEGLRFGLLMGLFSAMLPLIYVNNYNFTSVNWFWVEGLFFLIQGALGGIAIAYVYGKGAAATS